MNGDSENGCECFRTHFRLFFLRVGGGHFLLVFIDVFVVRDSKRGLSMRLWEHDAIINTGVSKRTDRLEDWFDTLAVPRS